MSVHKHYQISEIIYENEIRNCQVALLVAYFVMKYFNASIIELKSTVYNNAAALQIKVLKTWSGSNTFKYVCVFQLLCISVCVPTMISPMLSWHKG